MQKLFEGDEREYIDINDVDVVDSYHIFVVGERYPYRLDEVVIVDGDKFFSVY